MGKQRSRSSKASPTVRAQQETVLSEIQQPRKEYSVTTSGSSGPLQQSEQLLLEKRHHQSCKSLKKRFGNRPVWWRYIRKLMAKKYPPLFTRLPSEIRLLIYKQFFAGRTMIDITTTQRGDFRRKYGAQSLLFVSKKIRSEAMGQFFKTCTFQIHHFRLHHKHRYMNPLTSLLQIRHLNLLWTPPPRAAFTTKGRDKEQFSWMANLQELTIDLFGIQYMKVDSGDGELELHSNIIRHFEARVKDLPRWMKQLLRSAPDGFKIYLRVYFFAAPVVSDTFFTVSL